MLLQAEARGQTMTCKLRLAALAACAILSTLPAAASAETLFKIVTAKDDVVVGVNDAEWKELGGNASGIAKAIAAKGALRLWQYNVTRKDGEIVVAPRPKMGVLANASLRVERYTQPYKILTQE
jgi:hypothetical protein